MSSSSDDYEPQDTVDAMPFSAMNNSNFKKERKMTKIPEVSEYSGSKFSEGGTVRNTCNIEEFQFQDLSTPHVPVDFSKEESEKKSR